MLSRWFRMNRLTILFCLMVGIVLALVSTIHAQEGVTVEYGTNTVGTVPTDGATVSYSFNGNPGDLVTARAVGLTPGMDPNLTLSGPAQEVLVTNDNTPLLPATTDAEIVFRLFTAGPHTLTVSGTAGDFLLTLQLRPQVISTTLVVDEPTVAVLPLEPANQVFVFNTHPFQATTLLIDAEPFNLDAFIEIRDSTGQVIAMLGGDLDTACLSLGPGDEVNEMTIRGSADAVGEITFSLSNTACTFAAEPIEFDVQTIPFEPIAIPDVCAASSFFNVNIRTGPGLNYPVITLLFARTPIQVIGVSEDGNWYVVQGANFQGWVAGTVTFLTGPCDGLPVVPAPPPPASPPTPGFIIITGTPGPTQTPVVVTGTPGPTATPDVITTTPEPGATETAVPTEIVETATGQPTVTITPEISPTGTLTAVPLTLEATMTPSS